MRLSRLVLVATLATVSLPLVPGVAQAQRGKLIAQAAIDENGVPLNPDGTSSRMPPREILVHKPSGFWTSNRPAVGGAYRWRLLAIGTGLVVATGLFMLYLLRRTAAARRARP